MPDSRTMEWMRTMPKGYVIAMVKVNNMEGMAPYMEIVG
jgi:hypothetical protein